MKKIFVTLIALSLVSYAPAQADSSTAVNNRTKEQSSKATESSEPAGNTDGLAGKSDDAGLSASFAKDMNAPGLSLIIFPDAAGGIPDEKVPGKTR